MTTATVHRKFGFDTEFSADGRVTRSNDAYRQSYTREEMEKLTAAAFEKGKKDEIARAEAMSADAMRRIADAMGQILGGLGNEALSLRNEAAMIALASARKISGAAIARFPEENVLGAIEDAMSVLRDSPRLIINVSPDLHEQLRPRVSELAESFGYGAAVIVRADPKVAFGDAALVWGDGAITLDHAGAFARLEELIERRLADTQDDNEQADLFGMSGGH